MSQRPAGNRLASQTSPYLIQHAHNPVDWFPWGPEALESAARQDKPILLSIGYSACHWCHVMAHESFEDEETAEVMNKLFVNIKVDREERPDLDKIYQTAHQLLAQRPGGWPLTAILTPQDRIPFFAGTYFPREPRYGMPAFKDLLRRIEAFYRKHRDDIGAQNHALVEALERLEQAAPAGSVVMDPEPLELARRQLQQAFDVKHGGFGDAPKFPHPTNLERLLRHYASTAAGGRPDEAALDMAVSTLRQMARGGIYDQVGGGFCRYSVDAQWMIPHFEKMLYDNGPLLALYAEAYLATGDSVFSRVTRETADWVVREMQSPEGGYFSTLDADSEGEEGKFYVWDREEVRGLIDGPEYETLSRVYGLDRDANFEGRWHLHGFRAPSEIATELGLGLSETEQFLRNALDRLFTAREKRIGPGRDEKVLTAWNGLMIRGMATAGRVLDNPRWLESAEAALDFIRQTLWRNGRLLATSKDGRAHLPAYLDDYAFLMDGILTLLQARWRAEDLTFCLRLADVLLAVFEDGERGGFFFTADDHEALIHRPKPFADEAIPAGNGIAAHVLGRLGHLLGEPRYLKAAERTLEAAWSAIMEAPYAHNALLMALEEHLFPPQTLVLRGDPETVAEWRAMGNRAYAPRRLVFAIPSAAGELPGILSERSPPPEGAVAYLCEGFQCGPPITDKAAFERALGRAPVTPARGVDESS